MITSLDANVIIKAIIDKKCLDSYRKFYQSYDSFLCFTVNREVKIKQLQIFTFLQKTLALIRDNKNVNSITKSSYFIEFSKKSKEIFNYINERSFDSKNLKKIPQVINNFSGLQENLIHSRENLCVRKLFPKNFQEVEKVLGKKDIKKKFEEATKIPENDRTHLCLLQDYGENKVFKKILFVTIDENDLLKNQKYIEKIFDFVEITDPEGHLQGTEF